MFTFNTRDRSAYLRITGVLFLVFAAGGMTAPLLSTYIKSLGASTSQIGLVFATYQAASLASQYWWGRRSDRIGRRKPLIMAGVGALTLVYVANAAAVSYEWLYPVRIIEGLAFAAYSTGSLALIGDLLEDQEQRGRFMGQYRMVGSLAFATAALTGGWVSDTFGIRVPLLLAAGFFALGFVLISQVREQRTVQAGAPATTDTPATTPSMPPTPTTSGIQLNILAPFLGLSLAWFFGMGSVASLWPVFMQNGGYSQTQISGLWALAAAGEVFWLFVAGILADRLGRKWVIITGVIGMACIYTSYTFASGFVWFVIIQMFRSFTYSCYETPALLYATSLGLRQQRGRLAGLYYTSSAVGGIAGSALGGMMAQAYGMPTMFRAVAIIMASIGIGAAIFMPGEARKASQTLRVRLFGER